MNRRPVLILALLIAAGVVGVGAYQLRHTPRPDVAQASGPAIGGPFQLIDQNGRAVSDRDLHGKPTLMFFGFTYCPEVCPTTLTHITAWLKALGPDADKLNVVYVTIDPERDTPKQLHDYLSAFDSRIRGLTGKPEAIAAIAKAYRVYYQKIPLAGGGYTMDHSAVIYMMDARGRFAGPISYDQPDDQVLPRLRDLVRS